MSYNGIKSERGGNVADNKGDIVMFPKWERDLKMQTEHLVRNQKFQEALEKLNLILAHDPSHQRSQILKLTCLLELDRLDDANEFAGSIIDRIDPNYAQHLEDYLNITQIIGKQHVVIEVFEREKKAGYLKKHEIERLHEIYKLNLQLYYKQRRREINDYLERLENKVNEGDGRGQWQLVKEFRDDFSKPPIEIVQVLTSDKANPVVKTLICKWLKESNFNDVIEISKFGETLKVKRQAVSDIKEHVSFQKTLNYLDEIEQKNPTLYKLVIELLERYAYVKYPLLYNEDDAYKVAKALISIGNTNINLAINDELTEDIKYYRDEIKKCDELYLNIIEH